MDNKIETEEAKTDIHDRIAEAYSGGLGKEMQIATQKRMHWVRDNVTGNNILDIGCSQGIGAILLARVGKTVLGVDISQKAVDEANALLLKENNDTQKNVTFKKEDFLTYDSKNMFDTITITEVLEHLENPEEFVYKAKELLSCNGELIVTVPFGINEHPDHKKTYYFHDIYKMLYRHFDIQEVLLLGKWIGFIGRKKDVTKVSEPDTITLEQLKKIEEGFYAIERKQLDLSKLYLQQRNDANKEYREQVEMSKLYLQQRNDANKKYSKLWDKVKELTQHIDNEKQKNIFNETNKKQLKEKIILYKEEQKRLKEEIVLQERRIKESAAFQLGYLLIHKTKSLKDILRLPFRIRDIWRRKSKAIKSVVQPKKPKIQTKTHTISGLQKNSYKKGVSVVIPSYKSEKTIKRLLISLQQQTLARELFEIIIVINGEKDNTEKIVTEFKKLNPELNIVIVSLVKNGSSRARNEGLNKAKHMYVTFIDDDDSVSPNYLSAMHALSSKNTIVFSQIVDVYDEYIDANNYINSHIMKTEETEKNMLLKCHSACRITACKLMATEYAKTVQFDVSILNGEDGVFYAELYSRFDFKFQLCKEATYYRFVVANSLSRQPLSYTFNVEDRLKVISKVLCSLQKAKSKNIIDFINIGISGQIGFVNRYIEKYPEDYMRVVDEIRKKNLPSFLYKKIVKPQAKALVISYCFAPYVDTSAIVMAKRILEREVIADVVYANMSSVREKDETLLKLGEKLILNRIEIQTAVSFSAWEGIEDFITKMMKELTKFSSASYETVYSRVMWPASHFAAYEYKINNQNSKWVAEFSDPILFDIQGKERYSEIKDKQYLDSIKKRLRAKNLPVPNTDNVFFWCEYLAYAFADELVYTNKNQLEYMLKQVNVDLHAYIIEKSIIRNHPILPKKYYQLKESNYFLNDNKVNLAYFGAFYQTRKLNDIVKIMKKLPQLYREKVMLHIFTNTKEEILTLIEKERISENFKVNNYVDFFDFLNLVTRFDCLVVNDAITKPEKSINPYLPSKLSDYLGGDKPIWALYENDSILSQSQEIKYKSELTEIDEGVEVMKKIIDTEL